MGKTPLRISVVSYLNAKPFVYGIQHSGHITDFELALDPPAICAEKLKNNEIDIGLAPVAIIPELKEYYIIPDFCIGSNGPVQTVMLYSDVPLRNIRSILLDYQSKTSCLLVQILAKHWWKINPSWIKAKEGYEKKIKAAAAGLIIGDRNFNLTNEYKYSYDLSEEWKLFTGLPFVFACWISNKKLDETWANSFYQALKFGVDHRNKVIDNLEQQVDEKIARNYIFNHIQYNYDDKKKEALEFFLKLGKEFA